MKNVEDIKIGVIGHCFQEKKTIFSSQGKNDRNFNRINDIDTNMPLITFPIEISDEIIGVLQMESLRKRIGENFIKKSFFYNESFLKYFSNVFGINLIKFTKK